MSYTVKRTQYPFDSSGLRCKSQKDIIVMRRQWETFEKVENYNDIIYQRIQDGLRDQIFYQFADRGELSDYNNGQQLHMLKYPTIACSFDSISMSSIGQYPILVPAPNIMGVPRCIHMSTAISASEKTALDGDMATYMFVSSYNSAHTYKYIFTSAEERLAYHRAERSVLAQ